MFIEINDMSTGTLVTEPLNAISIDFVYKKEIDGKFCVIYVLTNGLRKVEQFDTDAEADDRLDDVKAITIGGGGGGGYVLPIASATKLGGVKVGENLSIDSSGVLSATGGSGSDTLTLDMSEVATTEVMHALINGQSPITINVTEQSHPTAFQELTDIFEDSRFGSANLNVLISNDILNNIIIPAESNLGSQFVTPAISAVTTFGISTYLSIQINQSANNLYIVSLAVDAFADKQDTLVSGTNIKTINSQSLVGSGNIAISAGQPTVVDAHWTDAAREFIFADKPVGTYLVHNGSTGPQSDITSRTNMSFRASTATSSRVTVTAQWGIIYIIKAYNDAATDEIFGYALFANGQTEGTMEFKLQSITRLSSGYRVSFNNMMVTNNNSPIKKMIRLYSSSSTYAVDDLVLNTDGWFYRCTTAITTPEAFNSSHWSNFEGYGIDKYIKELISQSSGSDIPLEKGSYSLTNDPGIQMVPSTSAAANVASGMHSVAFGALSQATSREAVAMGYNVKATGQESFACGDSTQATGPYAFASGYQTKAQGYYSHAEGHQTKAGNTADHAEGRYTEANGGFAHAEGLYTIANANQHAQGQYNINEAANTGIIHIVGNGTGTSARSNAHTLYNNGDAWFAGDVYVGSTSGTDKDSGSVKLAKESQLPNITSTTTDPGAGSTLAEGAIVLVYE